MKKLILAVVACVGLSGCVIVADGEGSSLKVSRGTPMGPYLRSFSADGQKVQATIITNCTQRADFEVIIREISDMPSLSISQHADARCEGPVRDLPVYWTYDTLDLASGQKVRVNNQIAL